MIFNVVDLPPMSCRRGNLKSPGSVQQKQNYDDLAKAIPLCPPGKWLDITELCHYFKSIQPRAAVISAMFSRGVLNVKIAYRGNNFYIKQEKK